MTVPLQFPSNVCLHHRCCCCCCCIRSLSAEVSERLTHSFTRCSLCRSSRSPVHPSPSSSLRPAQSASRLLSLPACLTPRLPFYRLPAPPLPAPHPLRRCSCLRRTDDNRTTRPLSTPLTHTHTHTHIHTRTHAHTRTHTHTHIYTHTHTPQHPLAVAQLVSTIAQLCTEGPPSSDQEWMAMTDADENAWEAGDAQETDVQSAAIDAMGTLLESLATDVVGPPFFKEVSAMIALRPEDHDPASSSRAVVEAKVVAGLLLISQCIDNAPHLLHEFDSQLESVLMHFIEHSKCMRVRHAAMGVVRELALEEDPPEWLKTKTTQNVIRCLCESLQQETVARCKRAALSALAQLFEMLQDDTQGIETLRPLIDDLVHKVLVPTVQSSNDSGVTEKCFACVAALAGTAKQHFAPHYPLFASAVKTVITQAVTPETRTLVETCIDAAGVLAECAPVAVVAADAVPLVQRMTELMLLPDEDCMHGAVLPVGRSYLAAT
eukprot:GHVU01057190.1.p1 GENE.GHVU01057190.1~~GHVU01057190.1.p1  ORF type:complete len:491 (-),score=72.91 GHVU01057190.1:40-1512(-)